MHWVCVRVALRKRITLAIADRMIICYSTRLKNLRETEVEHGSDPIVLSRCVRDDWSNSVINANRLPVLVYEKIVRIY